MPLLESNYYALWLGKQSAKGTPNTTPGKRAIMVGGNLTSARDDGEENYSDLTKYGNRTDWVNSLVGSGEPALEATPDELAYVLWLMHGAEAVTALTAVTGPPAVPAMSRHRFTPTTSIGHYFTAFLRVGSTALRRHQFNDCLITRVAIEASTANKAVRVTPRVLSLDPSVIYSADPAAALPTDRPFLHTDLGVNAGTVTDGSMTIDGVTFRGLTQWNMTIDDAWEPVYGDTTTPYDLQQGSPSVTCGATLLLDASALQQFNKIVYGTASPTAGTKPSRAILTPGSLVGLLRQRDAVGAHAGRELSITVPGVKWNAPDAPAPNPDGGVTEIALAGSMRVVAGQPAYTIDVNTNSTTLAFTV
jgi:hypothetical protein